MTDALKDALLAGCVVVFAAGNWNDPVTNHFPNYFPEFLTVGGTDKLQKGKRWFDNENSGSSYGENVDVAAPAKDVVVPIITIDKYGASTGTSFAAPQVSGLAALLLSYFPDLTSEQVVTRIKETARPYAELDPQRPLGKGEIQAYAALTEVVLEPIGPRRVAPGDTLDFTIRATGPKGSVITYGFPFALPDGVSLNSQSGRFTWRPNASQRGTYFIVLNATATPGNKQDSETVLIRVGVANSPPEFLLTQERFSVNETEELNFALNARDPNGDSITYSAEGLPAGATLDRTSGAFRWKPDFNQAGEYTPTFIASDGSLAVRQTIVIQVNNVNRPPTLNPVRILPSSTVDEGSPVTVNLTASDPDGERLVYSMNPSIPGASLNSSTGGFQWTPAYNQGGNPSSVYPVTFTVSDGTATDSKAVSIMVRNKNGPPELAAIPDQTVNENEALTFTLSATDPDGDAVTYQATGLPTGAQLTPAGVFTWKPSFTQGRAAPYSVACTAKDPGGRTSAPKTVKIKVNNVNRPPVLTSIPNKSVRVNQTLSFTILGSDPDGGTLTYGAASRPTGAQFNSATRQFTWRPTAGQQVGSPYVVTFSVTDGSATATQNVTITVTP